MPSNPHSNMIFRRIETRGILPDGRIITSWNSYPKGAGKDVYDRIVDAHMRAFGVQGSRIVGTPMDMAA